jgi:4-hydroxybenzoate polyprenyltransferase
MKAKIAVFRPLNLIMMMVLMQSIFHFLIKPIYDSLDLQFVLDEFHHFLLALDWALIAAGGYLINNYYDYETDRFNKPERLRVSKEWLMKAYFPVAFFSIILGAYLGWKAGLLNLGIIGIICTFLLWKYAEDWKGKSGLGSVVVSLLIALLVWLPAIFEFVSLSVLQSVAPYSLRYLVITLGVYASFAFLVNLIRELVKTLEDEKGDRATGWNTFAVAFGAKKTHFILWCLFGIAAGGIIYVLYLQSLSSDLLPLIYTLLAVFIPELICLYLFQKAQKSGHYSTLSKSLKLWMFGGISTLAAYYLLFLYS